MMNNQEFFNRACDSLRNHGNQYGSEQDRGWNWINPDCTSERCAIAKFVRGNSDNEILDNLRIILGTATWLEAVNNPVVYGIVTLFDTKVKEVNTPRLLEKELEALANRLHLVYTPKTVRVPASCI